MDIDNDVKIRIFIVTDLQNTMPLRKSDCSRLIGARFYIVRNESIALLVILVRLQYTLNRCLIKSEYIEMFKLNTRIQI